MGVQVLPSLVGEPLSPRSPDGGVLSDEDERHRKLKDKKRQHSKKHHDKDKENRPLDPQVGWKVKETTQWQYPDEWRITDVVELQLLDDFINLKVLMLLLVHQKTELTIYNKREKVEKEWYTFLIKYDA